MCGRFVQVWDADLQRYVRSWLGPHEAPSEEDWPQGPEKAYNVCPTESIGVLVEVHGDVVVEWMRWGVPAGKRPVVNTRIEAALESSMWAPLMDHRAVVPMNGFYEWQDTPEGKQPLYYHREGEAMMVAALHARREIKGEWTSCVSILTGPATTDVADVHDRQPVVLRDSDVAAWLNPDVPPEDAVKLAEPQAGVLVHHAVTRDVGRNTASGAGLIEPAQVQKQGRLF